MKIHDEYVRNMQVYVIECSFILVKFTETKKKHTGWSQNLGLLLHFEMLLTNMSAIAIPKCTVQNVTFIKCMMRLEIKFWVIINGKL